MIKSVNEKVWAFGGLATSLAVVASAGLSNPAQAASIAPGPGIFSFDGTATITVILNVAGDPTQGFTTSIDFGANGFGTSSTEAIDLAKLDEFAANGTGAFGSFVPGGSVTIKDLSYAVPAGPQPPSIPVVLPDFLALAPSTGPGPGDDTFDLGFISAPNFSTVPSFGTVLAFGGGGTYDSSSNPPGLNIPGVGVFTLQFPNLTAEEVQNLFATGNPITQTYSASFQINTASVPEPGSITGLIALGIFGSSTMLLKRRRN